MTVMDDPVKPKIMFNHQTLTTTFLDPRNLKKLKNNLKSLGTQNKQLNHYLQMTYRIINDLELARAEHRRRPKHVRPADKNYVNTVEFVRIVAEIVAGHILNAVCGGSVGSPKADDGIAERLLNELLSHMGSTDRGTQDHTHGDHIRLGVVNAVAEMLTTAKGTGGLPVIENVAKTTLSPEAEAERQRRGAAATMSLVAGKNKYNYCDTGKSNPRVQASRNKKYELPNFERRKSNHRLIDIAAVDEKLTSWDGVKSEINSRSPIKAQNRPKLDKSGNEREQRTTSTQKVTRKIQLQKPVDSRTGQIRPTNVIKNNYTSKADAQKKVGDDFMSGKSNNISVMVKSQDRIPRETTIGGNAVNNKRFQKRKSIVRRGVIMQLQKNISRRKLAAVDEPKTGALSRIDTRKSKSNTVDSPSNTMNGRDRRAATGDDRKKLPAKTTDKNQSPAPTGALLKKIVGTSRTREKTPLANVEGNDDKSRKLYNRNKTFLEGSGIVEKSKTTGIRNGGAAIVEKSKTTGTKSSDTTIVEKLKTARNRNGGAAVVKKTTGKRNGGPTIVEKLKIAGTRNGGSVVEKSKNSQPANGISKPRPDGKRDETASTSKTSISPVIDYHDDASLTATHDKINKLIETKKTFSAAETTGGSTLAPTDVRDDEDDDGGGVKNVANRDTGKDRLFVEHDLIETRQDQVKSKADKAKTRAYNAEIGAKNSETEMDDAETGPENTRTGTDNDKTDQNNSETVCNRINEENQDETGQTMTTVMAVDGAGSRRTDNSCIGDDKYKLRMSYVLDQLRQCQNRQTSGLYQAKRKCSKYEVTSITEEEYCKQKNIFYKQTKNNIPF